MYSSLHFSNTPCECFYQSLSFPFLRDFHLHIFGFSQYAEEIRHFTSDDFEKLSVLYQSLYRLVEESHADVSNVVSLLRRACPNNVCFINALEQLLDRIQASKMFFSQNIFSIDDVYFVGKFHPGKVEEDVFEDLWIYFSRSLDGEGDFDIGFCGRPIVGELDTLRLATVGFTVTPETLMITKILGTTSFANNSALRRFGRLLSDGHFFEKLERSLGAKAFNFLIGLLIKICESKGIPKIQGVKREFLPNFFVGNIHHSSEGPLFSCGFREEGSGIFQADLQTPEGREKCFARILGKKPELRASREKVFSAMIHALELSHPQIFTPIHHLDFHLDAQRMNVRNAFRCSLVAQ